MRKANGEKDAEERGRSGKNILGLQRLSSLSRTQTVCGRGALALFEILDPLEFLELLGIIELLENLDHLGILENLDSLKLLDTDSHTA